MLQSARYGPYPDSLFSSTFRGEAEAFEDIAKLDDDVGTNVIHESHMFSSHLFVDITILPSKRFQMNTEDAK